MPNQVSASTTTTIKTSANSDRQVLSTLSSITTETESSSSEAVTDITDRLLQGPQVEISPVPARAGTPFGTNGEGEDGAKRTSESLEASVADLKHKHVTPEKISDTTMKEIFPNVVVTPGTAPIVAAVMGENGSDSSSDSGDKAKGGKEKGNSPSKSPLPHSNSDSSLSEIDEEEVETPMETTMSSARTRGEQIGGPRPGTALDLWVPGLFSTNPLEDECPGDFSRYIAGRTPREEVEDTFYNYLTSEAKKSWRTLIGERYRRARRRAQQILNRQLSLREDWFFYTLRNYEPGEVSPDEYWTEFEQRFHQPRTRGFLHWRQGQPWIPVCSTDIDDECDRERMAGSRSKLRCLAYSSHYEEMTGETAQARLRRASETEEAAAAEQSTQPRVSTPTRSELLSSAAMPELDLSRISEGVEPPPPAADPASEAGIGAEEAAMNTDPELRDMLQSAASSIKDTSQASSKKRRRSDSDDDQDTTQVSQSSQESTGSKKPAKKANLTQGMEQATLKDKAIPEEENPNKTLPMDQSPAQPANPQDAIRATEEKINDSLRKHNMEAEAERERKIAEAKAEAYAREMEILRERYQRVRDEDSTLTLQEQIFQPPERRSNIPIRIRVDRRDIVPVGPPPAFRGLGRGEASWNVERAYRRTGIRDLPQDLPVLVMSTYTIWRRTCQFDQTRYDTGLSRIYYIYRDPGTDTLIIRPADRLRNIPIRLSDWNDMMGSLDLPQFDEREVREALADTNHNAKAEAAKDRAERRKATEERRNKAQSQRFKNQYGATDIRTTHTQAEIQALAARGRGRGAGGPPKPPPPSRSRSGGNRNGWGRGGGRGGRAESASPAGRQRGTSSGANTVPLGKRQPVSGPSDSNQRLLPPPPTSNPNKKKEPEVKKPSVKDRLGPMCPHGRPATAPTVRGRRAQVHAARRALMAHLGTRPVFFDINGRVMRPPIPPNPPGATEESVYGPSEELSEPLPKAILDTIAKKHLAVNKRTKYYKEWNGRYSIQLNPTQSEMNHGVTTEFHHAGFTEENRAYGMWTNAEVLEWWRNHTHSRDLADFRDHHWNTSTQDYMSRWLDWWRSQPDHPFPTPGENPMGMSAWHRRIWRITVEIWILSAVRPRLPLPTGPKRGLTKYDFEAYDKHSSSWYKLHKWWMTRMKLEKQCHPDDVAESRSSTSSSAAESGKTTTSSSASSSTPPKASASSSDSRKMMPPPPPPPADRKQQHKIRRTIPGGGKPTSPSPDPNKKGGASSPQKVAIKPIVDWDSDVIKRKLQLYKNLGDAASMVTIEPPVPVIPQGASTEDNFPGLEPNTLLLYGPGGGRAPLDFHTWTVIQNMLRSSSRQLILEGTPMALVSTQRMGYSLERGCGIIVCSSPMSLAWYRLHIFELAPSEGGARYCVWEPEGVDMVTLLLWFPKERRIDSMTNLLEEVKLVNAPRFDTEAWTNAEDGYTYDRWTITFQTTRAAATRILSGGEDIRLIHEWAAITVAGAPPLHSHMRWRGSTSSTKANRLPRSPTSNGSSLPPPTPILLRSLRYGRGWMRPTPSGGRKGR